MKGDEMTDTMAAILVEAGAMRLGRAARPEPGPGEVRIAVAAAGVNRADVMQRQGRYPPPPGASPILGLEVSGVVEAAGEGAGRYRPGDAVCALLAGGGYAERVVVDEGSVLPIPAGVSMEAAAALPEAVFTVWSTVFEIGALKSGETFMVHGATSGIGVTAIQMARAAGCRAVGTSRGADKAAQARTLGADVAVDATVEDFVAASGGVDVILDMVGADYFERNLKALNVGGRLVQIASMSGRSGTCDILQLMVRRLTVTGATLRSRPVADKARIGRAVEATVWPWVEQGRVRPVVDRVFPLAEAGEAHGLMESGKFAGKIVLRV